MPSTLRRATSLVALLLCLVLFTGCGLLYRTQRAGTRFVLYSDREDAFVDATSRRVETIFERFAELFELELASIETTTICLEGEDEDVVDHQYTPDLLGYYVPFFRLIRVDTRAAMTCQSPGLEQVLMHEIAHHFIAHEYPRATEICWLNEGLAGMLEVSVMEDGRAEFPLINPVLLGIARRAALEKPPDQWLDQIVGVDWEGFHESDEREEHYALAWSLTYFLITQRFPQELSLGQRIEKLYELEIEDLRPLAAQWLAFSSELDTVDELEALANCDDNERRLTARWAIGELGDIKGLESARALDALRRILDSDRNESDRAELASVAFLKLLSRAPHAAFFAAESAHRGLERVRGLIANANVSAALRARLVESISSPHVTHDTWIPVLVDALEARQPTLRAAAAATLADLGAKPTIANPAFWERGSEEERRAEIREWRRWLEERDER